MMNPQFPPPGQNNNAPSNPLYPPTSQEFNGVQNANIYGQLPPNGPQKPFDPSDMSQKMQNMNLNGPQGFPTIPSAQLPPGQQPPNFPPPTFGPGQLPPGRPPVSGAPQFPQPQKLPQPSNQGLDQRQFPPNSQPQQMPPQMQQSGLPSKPGMPPQQGMQQPGQMPGQQGMPQQPGQMPGQPGMPPQSGQMPGQPGMPPQQQQQQGMPASNYPPNFGQSQGPPGRPPVSGAPQFPQPQRPPQSSTPGPQLSQAPPANSGPPSTQPQQMPGQMPGQGMPPQSRMPPQPGMNQQPGMPLHPGMPSQPGQMPGQLGMPQQPGQMPGQPGMPPQPGQMPGQPGMPPQPGQMPGQPGMNQQPGMPPQHGMPPQPGMPSQPSKMPGQPGMPPQPGQMPGQPGMPPQPGQMPGQPGMPSMPQPGMPSQPSMPPQPGMNQQRGIPPQPGMPPQPGQMPGQPPMQQPMSQGLPPQPGMPPHPGQMQPGIPPQAYNQTMPGLPHMPPPLQQNQYPGGPVQQQPGFQKQPGPPGQPGYPGMPPMPNQQAGYGPPSSGYPPQFQQPGQPPFPAQQPSYPNQQYQQPQKRLDPDQMPSPIQVMADDQANRGGVFVTNDKGLVPPLVTTEFIVDDKGNASPRYIRSSMYSVPVTQDLLKQTSMPFCLVISPMAETEAGEQEPPLLDFAALTGSPTLGPVRCSRCKAYMCPNMKFIDAGRHFKCAFCKATTEVPMEYTQYINSMQQYGRVPAEMALGAYEILATKEYCRNNTLPNPPAIVFVLDVSYNAVKSGLVHTVCNNIMHIIESLPRDESGKSCTRVGFITYSSTVHFYNIKGSLAQPQMLSVGSVDDMFVPLLEGFLVTADDAGPVLTQLLTQLPNLFHDNKETETILLPAVQAGLEALKAADTSGQLLVFHTTLPSYNAPGKLTNREDRKLLGTDKEKQVLSPANTSYNEVGQACSAAGVCVELFVCNNSYVDAATIGQLPRLTGGQMHKYTYFSAETDGQRLVADVVRVVSRPTAHDAVMRVRTSTGVRATEFYGHFFMSNTTDVELAAIDSDKAIGVEIKHDDKLTAEEGVYIQAALLYTHRSGQRRLRVLNLALALAHQLADAYRSMELDTTINFLTKQAVWALREHPPRQIREGLSQRCARSLAAYRRHCASPSSAGQLVLPESMKLLPLYTSCMLRCDAIAGGSDLTCDDRSCAMYRALTADVVTSVVYTYPRLLPLHRLPEQQLTPLRASVDKMNDHGVYLLENGVHMLLWVGSAAPAEWVRDVFGVPAPHLVDTQVCELPVLDNPTSEAVRGVIADARRKRRTAMRVTVMRQHDKLEAVLRHFLVEDRGLDGAASYVDFLCHVHKEIRALL